MNIKLLNIIRFGTGQIKSLSSLDKLYAETIVQLPLESQIHYCRNLITCCNYDLKEVRGKLETRRIKELIQSAKNQLKELNKQ